MNISNIYLEAARNASLILFGIATVILAARGRNKT